MTNFVSRVWQMGNDHYPCSHCYGDGSTLCADSRWWECRLCGGTGYGDRKVARFRQVKA